MDHTFIRAYGDDNVSPVPALPRAASPPATSAARNTAFAADRDYHLDAPQEARAVPKPHANFSGRTSPALVSMAWSTADGIAAISENSVVIGTQVMEWPPQLPEEPSASREPAASVDTVRTRVDPPGAPRNPAPGPVPRPGPSPMERRERSGTSAAAPKAAPNSIASERTRPHEPAGSGQPAEYESPAEETASADDEALAHETDLETAPPGLQQPANQQAPAADGDAKLAAAWEVDRFAWPAEADRLYQSETEYFRHAGEKLRDASREGLRVLAVSAHRAGEGCTTLAICLARAAAAAGAKVALLDGNVNRPELGSLLGLDFAASWHESIDGELPLSEAAVASIEDGITLFPLGLDAEQTRLDQPAVSRLLERATAGFDIMFVDMGSLRPGAAPGFEHGTNCPLDAAIVVRDVRRTSQEDTLGAVRRFKEIGIDAVGVAENFAQRSNKSAA